uniref:Methyltransferase type 11 domain-containing protein n=1 Tax=Ditylenchus dipsaci TaxID=166011 RepID=A0A915EQR1_9BILA
MDDFSVSNSVLLSSNNSLNNSVNSSLLASDPVVDLIMSTPKPNYIIYNESKLAHQLLDNLTGIEIGASSHNPFGLNALNVDYTEEDNIFKANQITHTGTFKKVDIIASGDKLPFPNCSQDYEWLRVVKPGGYVFIVVPHKERTFDVARNRTTLAELIERHEHPNPPVPYVPAHYSVWITEDFLELCKHFNWKVVAVQDVDDKLAIALQL